MTQEPRLSSRLMVILKIALLTGVLFVLFSVVYTVVGVGQEVPVSPDAPAQSPEDQSRMALILLGVCFLQTVVLSAAILRSGWWGWRLAAGLSLVMFIGTGILSHIDSLFFLRDLSRVLIGKLVIASALLSALFPPIAVWILGRGHSLDSKDSQIEAIDHSPRGWGLVFLALTVLHIVLYFGFGYYVAWKSQAVLEFYGGEDPGSFWLQMVSVVKGTPWLIPIQVVRGALWGLLAVVLAKSLTGSRLSAGLIAGALFVTLFALPLVLPNPLMPDAVRLAHLVETVLSRGLFGVIAVWFLRSPFQVGHAHPRPV